MKVERPDDDDEEVIKTNENEEGVNCGNRRSHSSMSKPVF
jgi:hypothetical protein